MFANSTVVKYCERKSFNESVVVESQRVDVSASLREKKTPRARMIADVGRQKLRESMSSSDPARGQVKSRSETRLILKHALHTETPFSTAASGTRSIIRQIPKDTRRPQDHDLRQYGTWPRYMSASFSWLA